MKRRLKATDTVLRASAGRRAATGMAPMTAATHRVPCAGCCRWIRLPVAQPRPSASDRLRADALRSPWSAAIPSVLQHDDGQWMMPAKNYASTRFSGLDEINAGNVGSSASPGPSRPA